MKNLRSLAGALVLCGAATAVLSLEGGAASATPASGASSSMTSDHPEAAGKCRWVKTRGLVCETELGTIGL